MPVTQFVKQSVARYADPSTRSRKKVATEAKIQNCTSLAQILFEIVGLSFWLSVIDR